MMGGPRDIQKNENIKSGEPTALLSVYSHKMSVAEITVTQEGALWP